MKININKTLSIHQKKKLIAKYTALRLNNYIKSDGTIIKKHRVEDPVLLDSLWHDYNYLRFIKDEKGSLFVRLHQYLSPILLCDEKGNIK